jgi:hypothetical protein
MPTLIDSPVEELVHHALDLAGAEWIAHESCWRIATDHGATITARLLDDWLTLEAPHAGVPGWAALEKNAALPGLAKLALAPGGLLQIRAELPVGEEVDPVTRLDEVLRAFSERKLAAPSSEADLKSHCAGLGWPFTERADGRLVFDLDVPGLFLQAVLVPEGAGARFTCDLAALEALSPVGRDAIARLLLTASATVRLARPAILNDGPAPVARFEVVFPTTPSSSEISRSLESLSVAGSLCGQAIKALQETAVAVRYLALRGADTAARPFRDNT